MLPPVSVAIEKPTSPAAIAEPEPDDEPAAFAGSRSEADAKAATLLALAAK